MDNNAASIIELIDEALLELVSQRLSDQKLFVIDNALNASYYQRFSLAASNRSKLDLWFEVTTSGITFYFDRCNEIPEWSIVWITANKKLFKEEIITLFSSSILIEYKGKRTVIRLFNEVGIQVRQFTYTEGMGLNFLQKRTYKLYPPLVS